ncbi:MAG: 16S rRNA (adenine(1518)-N(6)/adenine(1519)-N(6))-dimethyltransferase RsmA [Candidatus Paceibacterota bacterium]
MSRRATLGQVFLKNPKIVEKIIQTINPQPKELILEIGPGKGELTQPLLEKEAQVIAVEKDTRLFNYLKEKFSSFKNLYLINEDIRDFLKSSYFKEKIKNKNYKIIGNIPYYLTGYLLRMLMELEKKPKIIVLMVQKEVALRIIAQPPKTNLLAILVQFYFQPKIVQIVKKGNFSPTPKVDSTILTLLPYKNEFNSNLDFQKKFLKIVKAGFSQPRKTLVNNLKKLISKEKILDFLKNNNFNQNIRPEDLSLKEWIKLAQLL